MTRSSQGEPAAVYPQTGLPQLPAICDVLVVGAGAAGLMAALAARGVVGAGGEQVDLPAHAPHVVLVNNESRLGLKILAAGGGRCNVTNAQVEAVDFTTDKPRVVRNLLRGFSSDRVRAFFEARGCPLREEPLGKLFPVSNKARDILDVLLSAVRDAGIPLLAPAEVVELAPSANNGWRAIFADGQLCEAQRLILATGGKSLPKTGSRGAGYDMLASLGHTVVSPLPALTPLVLADSGPLHGLAGLTVPVVFSVVDRGVSPEQLAGAKYRPLARAAGSLLITHQGVSGPAALDVSGAWVRANSDGADVVVRADFWSLARRESAWRPYRSLTKAPGACLPPANAPRPPSAEVFRQAVHGQRTDLRERSVARRLSERLPRALVAAVLNAAGCPPTALVKQLDGPRWRRVHEAMTQMDLQVAASAGFPKAEVTSGGLPLAELMASTLESKRASGLFCCGELVNATGRLGGFNFQWAWSSGYAAGRGAAACLRAGAR